MSQNAKTGEASLAAAIVSNYALHESLLSRFAQLLEESERRIDRTNKMVGELIAVSALISNNYVHHIQTLTDCRSRLLAEVEALTAQLDDERRRNRELVAHFVSASLGRATNNINVNR